MRKNSQLVIGRQSSVVSSTRYPVPSYITIFFPASFQFANGVREEVRKSLINSRTRLRRAASFSMRAASASHSPSYHSGGITSAKLASSAEEKFSMRSSQGWNDSHP